MKLNEKNIYNKYLEQSRKAQGKPFRPREDFSGFEAKPEYTLIRKLDYFFSQFPQIKMDTFFSAPYSVYPENEFFDLQFYTTQKAIAAYTAYYKTLMDMPPDNDVVLGQIKESFRFIGMFCIKNNISLSEYPTFRLGNTLSWMKHLREHNINIYVMFGFPNISNIIGETPPDELDLFFGDSSQRIGIYNARFIGSKVAKPYIRAGLDKISEYVEKNKKESICDDKKS